MGQLHPLLSSVEVPGPDGQTIDLCQPRSRGPLGARERKFLEHHALSLAYDPVQEGWLPVGAIDDLLGEDATDPLADPEILDRRINPALNARLEARALDLVAALRGSQIDPGQAEQELWSAAGSIVRDCAHELSAAQRRVAVRFLQARAARIANAQIVPGSVREDLHSRCRRARETYTLRPWRDDDTARFVELLDDERIWAHLPEDYPNPLTPALAEDLIRLSNEGQHHEVRAVERDGEVVGQVRLSFEGRHSPARAAGEAEISYWLGAAYWGQGIMSAVIPQYTDDCFRRRPLRSIFARVAEANRASARALEKSRYRYAGRFAAELDAEPEIRTYRTFREDYLGLRQRSVT